MNVGVGKGHASELSVKVGTPYGPGKVAVRTREQGITTGLLKYNETLHILLHRLS